MPDFSYVPAWPDELKELHSNYYRAWQRVRNLEAYVERVDPDGFYDVMSELEQAQKELHRAADVFEYAQRKWNYENGTFSRRT